MNDDFNIKKGTGGGRDSRPSIFSGTFASRSTAFGSSCNMSTARSIFKSGSILDALSGSRADSSNVHTHINFQEVNERSADNLDDTEEEEEEEEQPTPEFEGIQ